MSKIDIDGIEVECNPRRFAPYCQQLTADQNTLINAIKIHAEALAKVIDMTPNRAACIAINTLETAVMWAVKGVCNGADEQMGSPQWLARMGIGSASR